MDTNNNVLCEEKDIIDIAEAIRSKTNDTNTMYVSEMANKIISIQGGEDVTDETNAYTTKITQLESAVTALETELAGKATGGGGSVGVAIESGMFVITDNGMFDPGSNEYVFSSPDLNAMSRLLIIVIDTIDRYIVGAFVRNPTEKTFTYYSGNFTNNNVSINPTSFGGITSNDTVTMFGYIASSHMDRFSFIAT